MSEKKKEQPGIWQVSAEDMDELVICTVRYYLGRGSIAALTFPRSTLPHLFAMVSPMRRDVVIRDIARYVEDVGKGLEREAFKNDVNYWKEFLEKNT